MDAELCGCALLGGETHTLFDGSFKNQFEAVRGSVAGYWRCEDLDQTPAVFCVLANDLAIVFGGPCGPPTSSQFYRHKLVLVSRWIHLNFHGYKSVAQRVARPSPPVPKDYGLNND